jgi:hypothetical protein
METTRAESLYEPITSDEAKGVEGFKPEDFHPCKGTVLIIVAPIIDKIGNIHLPDAAQQVPNYGRVAAVPKRFEEGGWHPPGQTKEEFQEELKKGVPSDPLCPVKPGDWVIFIPSSGTGIPFVGRKDLLLLSYTDDLTSEILGVFDGPPQEIAESGLLVSGSKVDKDSEKE